jgi:hypothetical protein
VISSGVVNSIHQGDMRRDEKNPRSRHNCPREYSGTKEDFGAISADSASTFGGLRKTRLANDFFELFSASLSLRDGPIKVDACDKITT